MVFPHCRDVSDEPGYSAGGVAEHTHEVQTVFPHCLLCPERDLLSGHHSDLYVAVPENWIHQLFPDQVFCSFRNALAECQLAERSTRLNSVNCGAFWSKYSVHTVVLEGAEYHLDGAHVPEHLYHSANFHVDVPSRFAGYQSGFV